MSNLMTNYKRCLQCGEPITGRADRRFCSSACKNAWHYANRKVKHRIFKSVDRILHRNRNVLKSYYQYSQGTRFVPIDRLINKGFNPDVFTGIRISGTTGEKLRIVYDYIFVLDPSRGIKIMFRGMVDGFDSNHRSINTSRQDFA